MIARYASKNGSMSTTRSFSTGRPRIGSMVMVSCLLAFFGSRSRIKHLARQPVDAVDAHGVRAADAVRAGTPERQRAVEIPLHVVQQVEQPVRRQARHPEALPARAVGILRVETRDLQRHHHRAVGHRRQLGILGLNLGGDRHLSSLFAQPLIGVSTSVPSAHTASAPPACSPAGCRTADRCPPCRPWCGACSWCRRGWGSPRGHVRRGTPCGSAPRRR